MQARILDRDSVRTTSDLGEIKAAIAAKQPLWIELERQDAAADAVLAELKIHPLTIEDIWATRTFPKLDDYDNYVYAIVHGVAHATHDKCESIELDLVLGDTWVVTHDPGKYVVGEIADELARSPRLMQKGVAWLAHAVLDHAVDKYLPVVDELDGQLEQLETDVLRYAGTPRGGEVLRRILRFKRLLQDLRRMAIHQREILLKFGRGEIEEIPHDAVPFFRDVYDHFLRINDLVESYRDLVTSALEAYLSVQSNRMNEIMKTLTLIATVMLPITFIAGVYGMNFKNMPELEWPWGYAWALGLMGTVAIGTLVWFWKKGWIGSRELDLPED
jgi:magnesium transporter